VSVIANAVVWLFAEEELCCNVPRLKKSFAVSLGRALASRGMTSGSIEEWQGANKRILHELYMKRFVDWRACERSGE